MKQTPQFSDLNVVNQKQVWCLLLFVYVWMCFQCNCQFSFISEIAPSYHALIGPMSVQHQTDEWLHRIYVISTVHGFLIIRPVYPPLMCSLHCSDVSWRSLKSWASDHWTYVGKMLLLMFSWFTNFELQPTSGYTCAIWDESSQIIRLEIEQEDIQC